VKTSNLISVGALFR